MKYEELEFLISKDETRNVELKKSTGELREGMRSACAFLNSEGGFLIFGVTSSLKILGQIISEATRRDIAQALTGIEPAVSPVIEYIDIPDKPGFQIILIKFDPWIYGQKPYTFHGKPYYRLESVTKAMPRHLFDERVLLNLPHEHSWEMQKAKDVRIKDLDVNRIRGAVRMGVEGGRIPETSLYETTEQILRKWGLLERSCVRNAGAFLFSKKTMGEYVIRMARFRGSDKLHFVDNQQVSGNFFELLDTGMAFFFKHLSLSGEITGVLREEHLDIPVAALREALINALCHRDYGMYQCSIGIAIYDDRIEIESPGPLPRQLTPQSIKRLHKSYPRNKTLAEVLYRTMFLESWGSGVQRIMDACKAEGAKEPYWSEQTGFTVVTFPLKKLNGKSVSSNIGQNAPQNAPQKRTEIIAKLILENQSIAIAEMAKQLEVSRDTVKRDLKKLGYIWEGASKRGCWVQTDGGKND